MLRLHVEEALRILRRDTWLSGLMVITLGVGVGVFATSRTARVVQEEHVLPVAPGLHHVELVRGVSACDRETEDWARPISCYPELLLTADEAALLLSAEVAPRGGVTFLADAVARLPAGAETVRVRFASSAILELFPAEILEGRRFTAEEEARREPVAVIDDALAARWFPGERALGKEVELSGRRHRIVGVSRYDPTMMRLQDLVWPFEPNLHLPASAFADLETTPVNRWSACAASSEGELGCGQRWMHAWVQLDSQEEAEAFRFDRQAAVAREIAAGRLPADARVLLRALGSWRTLVTLVFPAYRVFELIGGLALVASAFGLMRLLMAKLHARLADVGVRRAVGASRACLLGQQLLAGGLIGLLAGGLGLAIAALGLDAMTNAIPTTHVRLALDGEQVCVALFASVLAAVSAALYPAWRLGRVCPAEALKRR